MLVRYRKSRRNSRQICTSFQYCWIQGTDHVGGVLTHIEYVEILGYSFKLKEPGIRTYIRLIAVEKMLNLFAATGHINYAKISRLYLQLM